MKIVTDYSVTSAPGRARDRWQPRWLFLGGAAGIWLDVSDRACLFQDAVGAAPVTAPGQTVGLILDKSRGLARGGDIGAPADATLVNAPEMASYTAQDNHYEIERDSTSGGEVHFAVPVGQSVEIDIEVLHEDGGAFVGLRDGGTVLATVGQTDGRCTRILRCPSGTLRIDLTNLPAMMRFRIHSIRALAGSHAIQQVTARRPVYQSNGTRSWLEFDGIDDCLRFDLGFSASDGFYLAYTGSVVENGRVINRATSNDGILAAATDRWLGRLTDENLDTIGFGFDFTSPHVAEYNTDAVQSLMRMNGSDGPISATQGKAVMLNDMAFGARTDGVAAFEGSLAGLIIRQGGLSLQEATWPLQHLTDTGGVLS